MVLVTLDTLPGRRTSNRGYKQRQLDEYSNDSPVNQQAHANQQRQRREDGEQPVSHGAAIVFFIVTALPHSGHRSGVARRSYPHSTHRPERRRRLILNQPTIFNRSASLNRSTIHTDGKTPNTVAHTIMKGTSHGASVVIPAET